MRTRTYALTLTSLCTALTIASAFISFVIPGTDVLFTAHVCAVLCTVLLLGPWWGATCLIVYLALGLLVLPLFSLGGGLAYVLKPSFGYLLGFPLMSLVAGLVARRLAAHGVAGLAVAGAAGVAALYAVALPYVALLRVFTGVTLPGLWAFLLAYCVGFLPLDAVKVALAAGICTLVRRRLPARARLY
jgi:biotin transport system substrate-specific component